MSDEPYRPGGEHCPRCGYRHDGRCEEARCQCGHTIFEHYDDFCGGCQCREFRHDGRRNDGREQFIKRCESFYAKSGFTLGPVAGWDARQPEIDALRDFARDLWDYAQVQWKGTRQYDVALAEARKLGIVEETSDAKRR